MVSILQTSEKNMLQTRNCCKWDRRCAFPCFVWDHFCSRRKRELIYLAFFFFVLWFATIAAARWVQLMLSPPMWRVKYSHFSIKSALTRFQVSETNFSTFHFFDIFFSDIFFFFRRLMRLTHIVYFILQGRKENIRKIGNRLKANPLKNNKRLNTVNWKLIRASDRLKFYIFWLKRSANASYYVGISIDWAGWMWKKSTPLLGRL